MSAIQFTINDYGETTYNVTNGQEAFFALFGDTYVIDRYKYYDTATETKRTAFQNLCRFFGIDEPVMTITLDENLLLTLIKVQRSYKLSQQYTFREQSTMLCLNVKWKELRKLQIPILSNEAFATYIIMPLIYNEFQFRNFKRIWKIFTHHVFPSTITSSEAYTHWLQKISQFLKSFDKYGSCINSDYVLRRLFGMYIDDKLDANQMQSFNELGYAYVHRMQAFNRCICFPTSDRLLRMVIDCEDRNKQSSMLRVFRKALDTNNELLLLTDVNSTIPAEWQLAIATKGTILQHIAWPELKMLLTVLYPEDDKHFGTAKSQILDEKFMKFLFRNMKKTPQEAVQHVVEKFEQCINKPLTIKTLKARSDEILDNRYSKFIIFSDILECGALLSKVSR